MQKIRRLLLLAERYVSTIEETHPAKRTILPHAGSFHGRAIKIKVITEGSKKEDLIINSQQRNDRIYICFLMMFWTL